MNNDQKYRAWKERPRPLYVSPDFSSTVIRRIRDEASQKQLSKQRNWRGLFEFFYRSRLARYAALTIAAAAGLSRFWLVFSIILEP